MPAERTCVIKWIDCRGNPTPDNNPAVGYAVLVVTGERFPICAEHAESIQRGRSHHGACNHVCGATTWKLEPLES